MINRILLLVTFYLFSGYVEAQNLPVDREIAGKIVDSRLNELSGIVGSDHQPSFFWTHNDSGDDARIFLIDDKAALKCIYYLEGVTAVDAEDIASFKKNGKSFLILADIGDNFGKRKNVQLYIFEEPNWKDGVEVDTIPAAAIQQVSLRFQDKPRDAEALFIDPVDQACYIISKRDFRSGLYTVDLQQPNSNQPLELKHLIDLPTTFVTAADISLDGQAILVKNLTDIFYWERKDKQSIKETVHKSPKKLTYEPEPQGEAICFGKEKSIFYTISEQALGLDAYLYRYNIVPLN